MASICLYFHVHQPWRVKRYRFFDIGEDPLYFNGKDDLDNKRILQKVASKCYLPTNKILLDLLNQYPNFKLSFSITGLVLEQMEKYSKEALKSFQDLVDTGRVEIISETYYHSLAFLYSKEEFRSQIELHKKKIEEIFGIKKFRVFRNTELIYNNELAEEIKNLGYEGILTEGADHILGWRSPNFLYLPAQTGESVGSGRIKLLLKNYKLSDDIAFRFSSRDWKDFPLTAEKFAHWISQINGNGELVNLFMDYETFGEHQWEDTGIFNFLRSLPGEILNHPDNDFVTPSEAIDRYEARDELDMPDYVSWADIERDLSAWLSNSMQHDAITSLYELKAKIFKRKDEMLIEDWRRLTTSDHFYYMCTKWFADGDVHAYFSPYESPYDAFRYYMNVLKDLELRLSVKKGVKNA